MPFFRALFTIFFSLIRLAVSQTEDTLGISNGYSSFTTGNWDFKLVKDSQTLASLKPSGADSFDFSPFEALAHRSGNGQYHLGDLTLRHRREGSSSWRSSDTAQDRSPVRAVDSGSGFASADLSPSISTDADLQIVRQWSEEADGDLILSFHITSTADTTIELGSLGMPIEFNNIFTGRAREDVEASCSFQDPYIGLHAGYVQVTPLSGTGPALVVTPLNGTKFEAWRFLDESYRGPPLYYQSQTFEGLYEFQVYTKAYAENEWSHAMPWNEPTSRMLEPNESFTVGLRLSLSREGITGIASTVVRANVPHAESVPGYIVPADASTTLTLNASSEVSSMLVTPDDALTISPTSEATYSIRPAQGAHGRVRLTIIYTDNRNQTIHYNIVKPAPTVLSDLGHFLTSTQYYTNTSDPFHRAPSVLSWDRSVDNFVLQDDRCWIAGLSDEGGAGSFLAASMKQSVQPNADEIALLEDFIHQVMWGSIQIDNGPEKYAVRKSLFYYGMPGYHYDPAINWNGAWDRAQAFLVNRAYDYVHVSAAYWALYRAARAHPDLVTQASWDWYLNQSYETAMYATRQRSGSGQWLVGYANDGLMGETVWGELLKDLHRENMTAEIAALEARMRARAERWDSLSVPFGSEMAWDSTGQEGVYYWCNYFNMRSSVTKTLDSILGFMPTVAHWGWNGNARRYWDFLYGGKIRRYERQIHHYGSGLNALPLLGHVKSNSSAVLSQSDAHMLKVAAGGNYGPLSNVDGDGFASAAFHSWPDTLAWDPYSGDYGPNFVGLSLGSGCFIVQEREGAGQTVVYGGDMEDGGDGTVLIRPRDAVRRRVYFGAWGVHVEIDAGCIDDIVLDLQRQTAEIRLIDAATERAAKAGRAVVWVENNRNGGFTVSTKGQRMERGGYVVEFENGSASFSIATV